MMREEVYLSILYDYYGELLTSKQKEYFEKYYFLNLSLSEIAEILNVSRNAVHKQLKVIEKHLLNFEEKLHLYEKDKYLEEILEDLENKDLKTKLEKLLK